VTTDRGFAPPGDRGYRPDQRGYGPDDRGYGPGAPGYGPGAPGYGPDQTGFAPPGGGGLPPAGPRQPQFVRCASCNVLQPLGSAGPPRCVSCGAPIRRWVAHPPPSDPAAKERSRPKRPRPYGGPPSYRGGHPRWSFPPVVWRELPAPDPRPPVRNPVPGLRWATWLAAATALCALVAAGAEIWRFALMLEGRTLVLSGQAVRASDMLVAGSGLAVVVAALLTAAFAVPALTRAHVTAAQRLGRAPSRSERAISARLLVPVWNVYGAGQIVLEIDRMLGASSDHGPPADGAAPDRPRASRITAFWWLSWILSSVLMVVTLAWGFGGSLQAIADTVQLHICLDLLAAVVAGVGAVMLHRFVRLLVGPKPELDGWVVKPPEPTRPLPAVPAEPVEAVNQVAAAEPPVVAGSGPR
jgi:hypothetical protein